MCARRHTSGRPLASHPMWRSYLYVPGDRRDRFAKASVSGAHAVILDLEDGVAPAHKDEARANVRAHLMARMARPPTFVRIDPAHLDDDVGAVADLGIAGLYLPKATATSLAVLDARLGERDLGVVALVESAEGLEDLPSLARHPRVRNLAIGEADLCAELGIEADVVPEVIWAIRTQLVVASAAAGIDPPTGPVSTTFDDLAALAGSTRALAAAGFGARAAIHPAQVPVINDAFAPTAEEIAAAERLVAAFDAAVARGEGVIVDDAGRMVDEAVARRARRLLG